MKSISYGLGLLFLSLSVARGAQAEGLGRFFSSQAQKAQGLNVQVALKDYFEQRPTLHQNEAYDVDLYGANLAGKDLSDVRFENVDLCRANLQNAKLHGAQFINVNFADANLQHADFTSARFKHCSFLKNAHVKNANFHNALFDQHSVYRALDTNMRESKNFPYGSHTPWLRTKTHIMNFVGNVFKRIRFL